MHGSARFADVLRSKLQSGSEGPTPACPSPGRPVTPPLFDAGFDSPPSGRARQAWREVAAPPPGRAVTALPAAARQALLALNDLGAGLGDTVSRAELRSAFRGLARRYHPDRHPGASPADQAGLAERFVRMTALSRVLAAALDAPTRH